MEGIMAHYSKHYIRTDDAGCIIDGWSDGPLWDKPTDGAVCLSGKGGYQFRLWPGGEENPVLMEEHGVPLYRWDGGQVVPRAAGEIAADIAALPPPEPVITPEQALGQQVAQLTLENGELRQVVNALGAEMVALKLQQTGGAQ